MSRQSTNRKSTKIGIHTQLSMHISDLEGTVARKTQPNTSKHKKSKAIFTERTAKEVNQDKTKANELLYSSQEYSKKPSTLQNKVKQIHNQQFALNKQQSMPCFDERQENDKFAHL